MAHVELTFEPNTEIIDAINEGSEAIISAIYRALDEMVVMDVSTDNYVAPITVDLDVTPNDEDAVMRRLGNGTVESVEVDEMVHSVDWNAGSSSSTPNKLYNSPKGLLEGLHPWKTPRALFVLGARNEVPPLNCGT